ncbi:MAG: ribonuclease H [Bacteroidetes bacterium]|nr:MAG: ribonuclease H [Bacteroidota bacterium]
MSKKAKRKYYVVWAGHRPGIYDTWAECKLQVEEFTGAKFRGFESLEEAERAFEQPFEQSRKPSEKKPKGDVGTPVYPSLSVDAACNMRTGRMEYRGVDTCTGKVVFSQGPFEATTNNVGEFLALVHALALLNSSDNPEHRNTPIYSDSRTAMAWVRKKHANTTMPPNERNAYLRQLIMRAEAWLRDNRFANPILKWETRHWGEIPADYGRK